MRLYLRSMRTIAVTWAAVMCLAYASKGASNLVVNGDFESPEPFWVSQVIPDWRAESSKEKAMPVSRVSVTDREKHSGQFALCLKGDATESIWSNRFFWIQSAKAIDIKPGTAYTLRFWTKSTGIDSRVECFAQPGHQRLYISNGVPNAAHEWQEHEIVLPPALFPAGVTQMEVRVQARGESGEIYYDDFSLQAADVGAQTNRIDNPSFEKKCWTISDPPAWHNWTGNWLDPQRGLADARRDQAIFHGGKAALRITWRKNKACLGQRIQPKNSWVKIGGWIKTADISQAAINYDVFDAKGQTIPGLGGVVGKVSGTADWTYVKKIVNLKEGKSLNVYAALPAPATADDSLIGTAWFDDIIVEETTAGQMQSVNLLCNGSFALCTNPRLPDFWGPRNDPIVFKHWSFDLYGIDPQVASPVTGTRVLRLTNPPEEQWIVNPNQRHDIVYLAYAIYAWPYNFSPDGQYTFSVYLKADREKTPVNLYYSLYKGPVTNFEAGTSWRQFTFTGPIKPGMYKQFGFFIALPDHGTKVWMAALQLEEGTAATAFKDRVAGLETRVENKDTQRLPALPKTTLPRAQSAPAMDGRLDDPAWNKAAVLSGFTLISGGLPEQQTEVLAMRDASNIYLAFRCFENQLNELRTVETNRDGNVFGDDSVEVFLSPHDDGSEYYQFAVNALGAQFDAFGRASARDVVWQSKTGRAPGMWTVEMAIPLASLLLDTASGHWRINLCRNRYAGGSGEYSAWSPIAGQGGFHTPQRFGYLDGITRKDIKTYSWDISDVALKKELDNTMTVSGVVTVNPAAAREVIVKAGYDTRTGVSKPLPLKRNGGVMPFEIPGLPTVAGQEDYDLRLTLVDATSEELVLKDIYAFTSLKGIQPLEAYVEYNYYTGDERAAVKVEWRPSLAVQIRMQLVDGKGRVTEAIREPVALQGPICKVISFPITDFPLGTYRLQVTALQGTQELAAASETFVKLAPATNEVRLNRLTRGVAVNGKPFTVIFCAGSPLRNTEEQVKMLKAQGMNTLWTSCSLENADDAKILQALDMCARNDMKVMLNPTDWSLKNPKGVFKGNIGALKKAAAAFVEKYKSHPALFGWYMLDEPNGWWPESGYREEDVAGLHNAMKAADPYHPVFNNWCHAWKTEPYGGYDSTDIVCVDHYPYWGGQYKQPSLASTLNFIRTINGAVGGRKPAAFWMQACGTGSVVRELTPAELRCTAYLNLIYGTRLLGYYHSMPMNPMTWDDMKRISAEATRLYAEIFAAPASRQLAVGQCGKGIHYGAWECNGHIYVIAANSEYVSQEFRLNVGGLAGRQVAESKGFFVPQSNRVQKGWLNDTLEPLQTSVYMMPYPAEGGR